MLNRSVKMHRKQRCQSVSFIASVQRYHSLQDKVKVLSDASEDGLGIALLQNGQPVRTLHSTAEFHFAQIRKGVSCNFVCMFKIWYFFIYGRDLVIVESDHKPLETIFKKPLYNTQKYTKDDIETIQRYSLQLTFKQSKVMFIADSLSREYLTENIWLIGEHAHSRWKWPIVRMS